jgi:hypothetical protein
MLLNGQTFSFPREIEIRQPITLMIIIAADDKSWLYTAEGAIKASVIERKKTYPIM